MRKLFQFFGREKVFVALLAVIILSIQMSSYVYRSFSTPPDRVFAGTQFYSDDYSIYVNNMLQGIQGRWTLVDRHTSEPHKGTLIHIEYLLWGKLMGFLGIGQVGAYHAARLVFGAGFIAAIYFFIRQIFADSKKRKLAFFLALFAGGFPIISQTDAGLVITRHLDWLTEIDPTIRNTVLPHYLLGAIFILTSLSLLLKSGILNPGKGYSPKQFGAAIAAGLALGFVHPVGLVTLLLLLAIYVLFSTVLSLATKLGKNYPLSIINFQFLKIPLLLLLFFLATAPVLFYFKYLMSLPPWNHMPAWEGVTQYNLPLSTYIGAIGPIFFLAPIGLAAMLSQASKKGKFVKPLLLLSWPLAFFSLIYFSYPFLGISQVRFMQPPFYLPFAVLAATGIVALASWLNRLLRLKKDIFIYPLTALVILISVPTYVQSHQGRMRMFADFSPIIYPAKDWYAGIKWLAENTHPDEVVLGAYVAGNLIPPLGGNNVYTGHQWATINREEKEARQAKFFRGKMSPEEARQFFKEGRIRYLFWGFQEASYGGDPRLYPFLTPVFSTPAVTIFAVNL